MTDTLPDWPAWLLLDWLEERAAIEAETNNTSQFLAEQRIAHRYRFRGWRELISEVKNR